MGTVIVDNWDSCGHCAVGVHRRLGCVGLECSSRWLHVVLAYNLHGVASGWWPLSVSGVE